MAEWNPRLRLVSAASMLPTAFRTSAIAASSPDIITTGHVEVPGDRGVPRSFGDVRAVERDARQVRARKRVRADAGGVVGAGVIADEDRGVHGFVDAGHHAEAARPRADHLDVRRELVDEQVLAVAVRVGDDDFGRARRLAGFDGRQRLPAS